MCPVRPEQSSQVGVDLVAVAEVARSIEAFGERYLHRVFTPGELAYCLADGRDPASHLAARFAAKEATFKALQGGDEAFDWRSIEVLRRPDGSCGLLLHDGMHRLLRRRGIGALRLSMSHDGGYAIAVVVGDSYRPHHSFRIARKGLRRMQRQ
jgi:holo-[acyl-carrier protein] synthase